MTQQQPSGAPKRSSTYGGEDHAIVFSTHLVLRSCVCEVVVNAIEYS